MISSLSCRSSEYHSSLSQTTQISGQAYFNNKQYLRDCPYIGNRGKPKKRKKLSQKLSSRYQTRMRLSRLYAELGNEKKSAKIYKCSSFFNVLTCGEHIAKRTASFRCNNRLCPDCSSRRANRLFAEYEPIVNAFLASNPELTPLHLILTQPQKVNETIGEARKRLLKSIKRLVDRKFFKDSFAGSLNSYEFTVTRRVDPSGLIHYHAHLLVFCKMSDRDRNNKWLAEFRKVWSAVSNGENKNLKVVYKTANDILQEVLKYIVKPQDIDKFSVDHLSQVEELRKHKMISTTGEFHNFVKAYRQEQKTLENEPQEGQEALKVNDPCPSCEKPLYELQMPIKQLIIFADELEHKSVFRE